MSEAQNGTQEVSVNTTEPIVQQGENGMFTTSLIIAEAFEKEHKDVLKAISNLECSPEFNERNFAPVEYKDAKGEMRPAYLAMGFTGKKAAAWKEKFLEAFNAMEAALLKRPEVTESAGSASQKIQNAKPSHGDLFSTGRKLTTRQEEALEGLIRMVAYIERTAEEDVRQELLVAVQVSSLRELQKNCFHQAFIFLWYKIFVIKSTDGAMKEKEGDMPDGIAIISGLLDFWAYISVDYSKQAVTNYVCNCCNISSLEEIKTDVAVTKAIFAAFRGIVGRTISPERMRFI